MHTEHDTHTYWVTMSRVTGHSVAYLRMRAVVRATLVTCALVVPFVSVLTNKGY